MQLAISADRHPCPYSPLPGLVPGIHVFAGAGFAVEEDVGAYGSSPWAEGPRVKPGHGVYYCCAGMG
jgi:hypothetical protein